MTAHTYTYTCPAHRLTFPVYAAILNVPIGCFFDYQSYIYL